MDRKKIDLAMVAKAQAVHDSVLNIRNHLRATKQYIAIRFDKLPSGGDGEELYWGLIPEVSSKREIFYRDRNAEKEWYRSWRPLQECNMAIRYKAYNYKWLDYFVNGFNYYMGQLGRDEKEAAKNITGGTTELNTNSLKFE